jgi:tetratricopeptide (TPR) repeat protein
MKKKIGSVSFFSALLLSATFSVALAQDGLKMIEREQPKKGIEALRAAAQSQPTPANYFYLGSGLLKTGGKENTNAQEALATFEKGIAADPKNPLCYVGKGRVQLRQNNLKDAEANFQKALDLTKSKDPETLNAIAEAWLDKPQFAANAKKLLEKSEGIKGTVKASTLLGDIYLSQGNGGLAVSNYEHAAANDPKDGGPHYRVGVVYNRSTNREAAMEAFKQAIAVDPTYTPAYKELAEIYYIQKNGAEAVKNQQKYMELTENPESGLVRMGYYQFMNRDFAKANELFAQADSKGLLKATGTRYNALAYKEAGDFANAQKWFERYFALDTADAEAASDWKAYGDVLQKNGESKTNGEKRAFDSLASLAFAKSLSIDPKQTKLQEAQADILLKYKKREAVDAFKNLIALRGKAISQDIFKLGQAFYYTEQFDSAAARFNQLAVMQPTMTVGPLWAGRAHAQLDPESTQGLAKPDFEKVIEVGSATPDKSKTDLIQAYSYLGYYYYLQKDLNTSLTNWKKVLELDPKNEQANTAVKSIEKMKAQPQRQ